MKHGPAHQTNLIRFAMAIVDGKLTLANVQGQTTPAHFARIKEVLAKITAGQSACGGPRTPNG